MPFGIGRCNGRSSADHEGATPRAFRLVSTCPGARLVISRRRSRQQQSCSHLHGAASRCRFSVLRTDRVCSTPFGAGRSDTSFVVLVIDTSGSIRLYLVSPFGVEPVSRFERKGTRKERRSNPGIVLSPIEILHGIGSQVSDRPMSSSTFRIVSFIHVRGREIPRSLGSEPSPVLLPTPAFEPPWETRPVEEAPSPSFGEVKGWRRVRGVCFDPSLQNLRRIASWDAMENVSAGSRGGGGCAENRSVGRKRTAQDRIEGNPTTKKGTNLGMETSRTRTKKRRTRV